jgi:hypothetical protein
MPASDKAIAIACLGDFTTLPPLPECNEPVLNSFITLETFFIFFFIQTQTKKIPQKVGLNGDLK